MASNHLLCHGAALPESDSRRYLDAAFDVSRLLDTGGLVAVGLAMVLRGMAGSLFGIFYIKARTLCPGVACHYLINWLSAILAATFRS